MKGKVFVTGGAGYVGCVLVPKLLEAGHEVVAYDIMYYGAEGLGSHPRLKTVKADLRDMLMAEKIKMLLTRPTQRSSISKRVFLRPRRPQSAVVDFIQCFKQCIVIQPRSLSNAESFKGFSVRIRRRALTGLRSSQATSERSSARAPAWFWHATPLMPLTPHNRTARARGGSKYSAFWSEMFCCHRRCSSV